MFVIHYESNIVIWGPAFCPLSRLIWRMVTTGKTGRVWKARNQLFLWPERMQKVVPVFLVVISSSSDHGFRKVFFLTVDLERNTGITGVPFGRTELSSRLFWIEFGALAPPGGSRGPWGLRDARKDWFSCFFEKKILRKRMKMLDEDGWMLEFRAGNDTKWSA